MIIKGYWGDKAEEYQQEELIKDYLKNNKITKFNIEDKDIKNFKISFGNFGRFRVDYSLRGNNLKYYVNLLNSSFLFYNNTIKVLWDKHWWDYKKGILKDVIIKELKGGNK